MCNTAIIIGGSIDNIIESVRINFEQHVCLEWVCDW